MRKIENKDWVETVNNEAKKVSLADALITLVNLSEQHTIPRGIEQFRTFNKISRAFTKAKDSGFILLEEAEYVFLKRLIENNLPARWGGRDEVLDAIELFVNAKSFNADELAKETKKEEPSTSPVVEEKK